MLIAVASVVATGCGTNGLTASPPRVGSGAAATSPPPAETSPRVTGSSAAGSVPIDESLRAHLPETVDGLPLLPAPESDAEVARVPEVVANGEAVLTALVADPAADEFAHVQLIRLMPGRFSDAFFRSWRDSFDEGFCAQAGGVQGTAEAPIADRVVFITTCAGGARAYHTWLESSGVLVAVSSVGERRLGERLLEGLEE